MSTPCKVQVSASPRSGGNPPTFARDWNRNHFRLGSMVLHCRPPVGLIHMRSHQDCPTRGLCLILTMSLSSYVCPSPVWRTFVSRAYWSRYEHLSVGKIQLLFPRYQDRHNLARYSAVGYRAVLNRRALIPRCNPKEYKQRRTERKDKVEMAWLIHCVDFIVLKIASVVVLYQLYGRDLVLRHRKSAVWQLSWRIESDWNTTECSLCIEAFQDSYGASVISFMLLCRWVCLMDLSFSTSGQASSLPDLNVDALDIFSTESWVWVTCSWP